MSQTSTRPRHRPAQRARTLWDQGRRPGGQVVLLSGLAALLAARLDLLFHDDLSALFDLGFVVVCLAAALAVRPRDFFVVGVLPPLLMLGVVMLLAAGERSTVAEEVDSMVQAVVSGLAHHAGGLVAGYAVTLGILALRQVALRNSGRVRPRTPRAPGRADC